MNESYLTVAGNVTADPVLRQTKTGKPFATFRLASTARRWDPQSRGYVDAGTNFVSVVAFNSLAANVVASVKKGEPVIVHGRLRVNVWAVDEGRTNTSVEIDAYNVGHDLSLGQSRFAKAARAQFDSQDRMAADEIQESLAEIEGGVEVQGEPSGRSEIEGDFDLATADPETDQYVVAVA
ncbi:MAG: single-stranded DNA-binding protein [Dermatophilaceae bacterium]